MYSRTRTRSSGSIYETWSGYPDIENSATFGGWTPEDAANAASQREGNQQKTLVVPPIGDSSTIADCLGIRGVNPVDHQSQIVRTGPFTVMLFCYGFGVYAKFCDITVVPSTVVPPYLEPTLLSKQQMRARAIAALEPQFSSGFSATNAIFELKDFKGMLRHVRGVGGMLKAQTAKHLAKAVGLSADHAITSIASSAKDRVRNLSTKTLAELTLEYDFAFKPLVADVEKVYTLAERAKDTLSRFNAQGFDPNTFHYTEKIPGVVVKDDGYSPNKYGSIISRQGVFHAQCTQSWHHSVDNALDQFLQHYGLQLTPKNIWDAIPFSFVVDWFYSVGKSLESVSRNTVTSRNIHSYAESYKYESVIQTVFRPSYQDYSRGKCIVINFSGGVGSGLAGTDDGFPVGFCKNTSYIRTIWDGPPLLVGPVLPTWRGPTLHNAVDALAMVRTAWGFKKNSRTLFNGPSD